MRVPLSVALLLVAALLVPTAAVAGPGPVTFVVDDDADTPIDSPTGCDATGDLTTCTLREAIWEANNNGNSPEVDQITFDLGAGSDNIITLAQSFQLGGSYEPNLIGGDLDITESVTIDGPGITVDASGINNTDGFDAAAGNQDRVFDVLNPYGFAVVTTIRGLTITGGFTQPGEHGGGVRATNCGAGVNLVLDDVTVTGNMADPSPFGSAYTRGGGVYSLAVDLDIMSSTISGNLAEQGGGVAQTRYGPAYGCADSTYADAAENKGAASPMILGLSVTDSTITGNAAVLPAHNERQTESGQGTAGAGVWTDMDASLIGVVLSDNGNELASPITGPDGLTAFDGVAPWEGGGLVIGPDRSPPRGIPSPPYLYIDRSVIDGNTAQYAGGGLRVQETYVDVHNTAIVANTAGPGVGPFLAVNGGGGMALVNVDATVSNATIAGNEAEYGFGILNVHTSSTHIPASSVNADFVTVADNTPATATATAPEFAGEDPPRGSVQVGADGRGTPDSAVITFFNSILQSTTTPAPTCAGQSALASISSVGGNTDDDGSCALDGTGDASPVTQLLGSVEANGGINLAGDDPQIAVPAMSLLAGAEAIDAAIDTPDSTDEPLYAGTTPVGCGAVFADQRGIARPQDGDNDGTAVCDRGAYERVYQPPSTGGGVPTVDVGVTKTGPAEVAVGDPVQYTIEVTNARNRADDVVVSDTIPSGLTLDGASAPCTTSGSSISCALGSLSAGETATITVDATADGEGTFTNTACATTSDSDTNGDNDCDSHTVTVIGLDTSERVEGPERITTAVAGSQVIFDDGTAQAVVLTRADDFPDAQAGTPLAIARDAAMLLSQPDELSAATEEEILRVLAPGGTVYLLGGTAALSDAVAQRVAELGYTPVRLGGANRFATAVAIAQELGDPGTLLMANGHDFPAAVVAGAAAVVAGDSDFAQVGAVGAAVVLTAFDTVPPETQAYLDGLGTAPELIPVGPGAAAAFPDEDDAILGNDRYELSVNVAEAFFASPTAIGVATGADFADALVGGSLVGRPSAGPGPMLLSAADALPQPVGGYVTANADGISRLFIFGGPAAITPPVEDELNAILGIEPTE